MTHLSVKLTGPNQPIRSVSVPAVIRENGDDSRGTAGHRTTDVLARSAAGRRSHRQELSGRFRRDLALKGGRCNLSWRGCEPHSCRGEERTSLAWDSGPVEEAGPVTPASSGAAPAVWLLICGQT